MARGIVKRPGKPAEVVEVDVELEGLQALVGGYVELVPNVAPRGVAVWCNEEGKPRCMSPNVRLGHHLVVGTIVVTGEREDEDGETEPCELTDAQVNWWLTLLEMSAVDPADFAVPS